MKSQQAKCFRNSLKKKTVDVSSVTAWLPELWFDSPLSLEAEMQRLELSRVGVTEPELSLSDHEHLFLS